MFELQFVRRMSYNSREGTIKVLQFRTKDKHVESSTTTPAPRAWTDWKDVPIVGET